MPIHNSVSLSKARVAFSIAAAWVAIAISADRATAVIRPEFDCTPANISSGAVVSLSPRDDFPQETAALGFTIKFGGVNRSSVVINPNGYLHFSSADNAYIQWDTPLSTLGFDVIAPFFADVNTFNGGSICYGQADLGGSTAFGVTWRDVAPYVNPVTSGRNTFQVVIVNRPDGGVGAFDVELNYGQIQWDTGNSSVARVGLWSGASDTQRELDGSGSAGQMIDAGGKSLVGYRHFSGKSGVYGYRINAKLGTATGSVLRLPFLRPPFDLSGLSPMLSPSGNAMLFQATSSDPYSNYGFVWSNDKGIRQLKSQIYGRGSDSSRYSAITDSFVFASGSNYDGQGTYGPFGPQRWTLPSLASATLAAADTYDGSSYAVSSSDDGKLVVAERHSAYPGDPPKFSIWQDASPLVVSLSTPPASPGKLYFVYPVVVSGNGGVVGLNVFDGDYVAYPLVWSAAQGARALQGLTHETIADLSLDARRALLWSQEAGRASIWSGDPTTGAGAVQTIPLAPPSTWSYPLAISGDGYRASILEEYGAFVWELGVGVRSLSELLTASGASITEFAYSGSSLSYDGRVIAGSFVSGGSYFPFAAVLIPHVPDADGDEVLDSDDNCPWVVNLSQADTDGDGVGDACETAGTGSTIIGGFFQGQLGDTPKYRWKQCPNCPLLTDLAPLQEEGGQCDTTVTTPDPQFPNNKEVVLSYSSSLESGFACCAYDRCFGTTTLSCDEDIEIFKWGTFTNAPNTNSDGDIFPDLCDNCPLVANGSQSDMDADGVGDACDSDPNDANHCSDTDHDQCDDCSSGHFDPATDDVICLPEPTEIAGLAAGLAMLSVLARRRQQSRTRVLARSGTVRVHGQAYDSAEVEPE